MNKVIGYLILMIALCSVHLILAESAVGTSSSIAQRRTFGIESNAGHTGALGGQLPTDYGWVSDFDGTEHYTALMDDDTADNQRQSIINQYSFCSKNHAEDAPDHGLCKVPAIQYSEA